MAFFICLEQDFVLILTSEKLASDVLNLGEYGIWPTADLG
jgi:hypothetical protein